MALQVNDVLNQVQTLIAEPSKPLQQRLLIWLNQTMKSIADMRDWDFLCKYATLTITEGEITLPADFKEFINLAIGTNYFYDRTNNLTDHESWLQFGPESDVGVDVPVESGTATLKYKVPLPTYTYGDTTLFPNEFINVLVDGTLVKFYRSKQLWEDYGVAKGQFSAGIAALKKNYNRNQPVPKYTKHGYIRRRQ